MVKDIIAHLHKVNARRTLAESLQIMPAIQSLQRWQCKRLLATHSDMAQQAAYAKAMTFFVEELYGPKDFSQRDADLLRVIPKLAKALPKKAMLAVEQALWLNALSFELDMAMAQSLNGAPVTRENYALAYRKVGRNECRVEQINIVANLGAQLSDVVGIPGISLLIKLSRGPAKLAGLLSMYDFLYKGYMAFKDLGDVNAFINPMIELETKLNAQLLTPNIDIIVENPLPNV